MTFPLLFSSVSVTGSDDHRPRPVFSRSADKNNPGVRTLQRKPAPPFVPSVPGTPPTTPRMKQTSGMLQYGFQPVNPRVPMTAYWTREGLRMSTLSPGQSWTQVGSVSEQRRPPQYHTTNPYAVTGYAVTPPPQPQSSPPEFGAHYRAGVQPHSQSSRSQASDLYSGIDRQYERDQRWSDGRDNAAGDTG
ncbi:hypothetical protein BDZ97DRAFT_1803736 [Flammula alnicola]|nr:hypothetical protein BDZ97DRAFT_1803736 [Flammula alnicola]